MDKLIFLVLFIQLLLFIACWGLMRELRLTAGVVEQIRKMLAKRQ